jgi:aminoglycoside phosphotransferase (APT) family kinase protein
MTRSPDGLASGRSPRSGTTGSAFPYATSHAIQEVSGPDGRRLLRKDLSPAALLPEARGIVPGFLVDPAREVDVYRHLLADTGLGTPVCYDAKSDPLMGEHWVLLEAVEGDVLWQVGELDTWCEVAVGIARLHAGLAARVATPPPSLLSYDRDFYLVWADRAASARGHAPSALLDPVLDRVLDCYRRAVAQLLALPRGIIHGELYPSNVLVQRTGEQLRVCPIDWEMAAVGPRAVDVAALTGGWPEAQRERLVAAYADAACEPVARVQAEVDLAELHLCVRWLGWAQGWQPPAAHDRDWLVRAEALCDRIAS